MIDHYIAALADVRERLEAEELKADFDFANEIRGSIPKDSKGFIHVLHEILVLAEDRPGVIAEIGQALGAEGININDIEVMKVREGEGGTLRLGFDRAENAENALEILAKLGYEARRALGGGSSRKPSQENCGAGLGAWRAGASRAGTRVGRAERRG